MHGRDCTTSTLSWTHLRNINWMLDCPRQEDFDLRCGINLECGLSQLIYNQGCLLFWNLRCFVSGLYFINIFQKIWILSSRNRFIQEQNEWIISPLPSFHLSKFWLHDKFIKYFWDHGNFWETIVNFYSFPSRLGLIKKLHSSFKISTLRVFEYYDGVIFLVAHCMRQNKRVKMFQCLRCLKCQPTSVC